MPKPKPYDLVDADRFRFRHDQPPELLGYVTRMLAQVALEREGIINDRDAEERLAAEIAVTVQAWLDVGKARPI